MERLKDKKFVLLMGVIMLTALFYQYALVQPVTDNTAVLAGKLSSLNKTIQELKTLKTRQQELSSLMLKVRSQNILHSRIKKFLSVLIRTLPV